MKKLLISAAVIAMASPAFAQVLVAPAAPDGYYRDPEVTGSINPAPGMNLNPSAERYSNNPAADGNANQLTKPVPNYGQTSEGNRAFYE